MIQSDTQRKLRSLTAYLALRVRVNVKDGDQVTIKGIYSVEANKELEEYTKSKAHYISLGGKNVRNLSNEGIQSLYSLTKVLDQDASKLTNPVF